MSKIVSYSVTYNSRSTELIGPQDQMLELVIDQITHLLPGESIEVHLTHFQPRGD